MAIVGVAGSVRHSALSTEAEPTVYVPVQQWPMSEMTVVVSTALSPTSIVGPVSKAIRSFDPSLPVANPRTLDRIAADATWRQRVTASLLAVFAGAALLLAALGVYGILSYTVAQRRREMALRMVLGARASAIATSVLSRSILLGGAGTLIGLTFATVAARAVSGLLYGVAGADADVFLTVALTLLAISGIAALHPAYRAARVPISEVLRAD